MHGCLNKPAAEGIEYRGPGLRSSSMRVTGLPLNEAAGALNWRFIESKIVPFLNVIDTSIRIPGSYERHRVYRGKRLNRITELCP